MDDSRWLRVKALFEAAADLGPAECARLLDRECAGDPELRQEVASLLEADGKSESFFDVTLEAPGSQPADESGPENQHFVGAYQVLGTLGKGGMGEVLLGFDARLQRRVAIKKVRRSSRMSAESRERFLREARAVAALSHPSIVQVHELLQDGLEEAIVMEHVEGWTVAQLAEMGHLDGAVAVRIARQIAEGLTVAHGHGLVHRDIKAENVMDTPAEQAKILDFGVVKKLMEEDDLTGTRATPGTVRTMSPEQACHEPVDGRSDLFSLGVLMYEMLAGHSPFRGADQRDTLHRIRFGQQPSLRSLRPEVPQELSDFIDHLLEKQPERRPQSALEVTRRLQELSLLPSLATVGPALRGGESDPTLTGVAALPPASRTSTGATSTIAGAETDSPTEGSRAHSSALGVAVIGLLAVLGLVAGGLWLWMTSPTPAPEPLVVAVLEPELSGEPPDSLAFTLRHELTNALAGFEQVAALRPAHGPGKSSVDIAREEAADEVLETAAECTSSSCRLWLRRLDGATGTLLWSSPPFEVPTRPEDSLTLANALGSRLRVGYADRPLKQDTPEFAVREIDYAAYMEIRRRVDAGEPLDDNDLLKLDEIIESSPRFLEGYHLGAEIARSQKDYPRAESYIQRAATLAPRDFRTLLTRSRIETQKGDLERAAITLGELLALEPGNSRVLGALAEIARREGRVEDSIELWTKATEQRRSWRNLVSLANVEQQNLEIEAARRHYREALDLSPTSVWVMERLSSLELTNGDLDVAEQVLKELSVLEPKQRYFVDLGTVYMLRRQPERAIEKYQDALAFDPSDRLTRLNLAEAEIATGQPERARERYRALLENSDSDQDRLIRAQCLARLGQAEEAVQLTRRALLAGAEDTAVLYQVATIFSILGEEDAALVYAQKALERGLQPRFLEASEFDTIRDRLDWQGASR